MNKVKQLCLAYGGWMLLALPVVIISLCLAVSAAKPEPRTIAEPPAETEITFDMDTNRAYTAENGIVVIPASNPAGGLGGTRGDLVPPAGFAVSDSEPVTSAEVTRTQYTLPEDAQMADGSVGLLSIPKLKLSVNVFETADESRALPSKRLTSRPAQLSPALCCASQRAARWNTKM